MERLSLLVVSSSTPYGINCPGTVLRCSFQPGWDSDFERKVFQRVNWPSEDPSEEDLKIWSTLSEKMKSDDIGFIDYPFQEVVKEDGTNKSMTNGSFINFDFSGLPNDILNKVLSKDLECEPINCEDLIVIIDKRGIDKRMPEERHLKKHKHVDVKNPILHEHSCIRECYNLLEN